MPKSQISENPTAKSLLGKVTFLEKSVVHLPLILLVTFFVYSNTFDVPFLFDDNSNIAGNPLIKDVSNIPSIFVGSKGPFASRPLMHATFALNYYFNGLDTWGYHVINLTIHLINGMFLYFLVLMTGRHMEHNGRVVRTTATLASFVFLIHPIQTDAVTYIVSRSMLLATAFYFLGMILFLRAVTAEKGKGLYIAGLFIASFLGMGSRENFATFPIMLVLYDLFFVSRFKLRKAAGHWKIYLPIFLSLSYLYYSVTNNTYDKGTSFPGIGIPRVDYFLTQFNVHWTYLRLLVLPINQNVDHDYLIARTLFEFPTMVSFLGYLGLCAVAIALVRKRPVVSFSVLWFLVTLFPISFGVTLMNLRLDDVIFEHRLYLPSAGVIVAAASGAAVFVEGLSGKRLLAAMMATAIVLSMLAGTSYKRNTVWKSGKNLWADAAAKSPRKARPHNNLGIAYYYEGQYNKAIEEFHSAIELQPNYSLAHNGLGVVYGQMGQLHKAIEQFQIAVDINPFFAEAHNNLGGALGDFGQIEKAIKHFQTAIKLKPDYAEAYKNLGVAYSKIGLKDEAQRHFSQARELSKKPLQSE